MLTLLLLCAINPDLKAISVPRPAGQNAETREYIESRLQWYGLRTRRQPFDTGINLYGVRTGPQDVVQQVFIVGSHYDSVRGTPGADDNASGCVVNLMVAQRKLNLKHALVHAFFDDEEGGLNGSEACAKQSLGAKGVKHDLMINLDMVGRLKPPRYNDPFDRLFKQYPWAKSITFRSPNGPSDHESFGKRGVPVVWLFTGDHRDYHTATDTPDKINEEGLRLIADYVCAILKQFDEQVVMQWYRELKVKK